MRCEHGVSSTTLPTISRLAAAAMFTLAAAASLHAGARFDLRPTPPQPPEGYAPHSLVNIDVFIVDTGNPQGDLVFGGLQLDFTDTAQTLTFPGADAVPGNADDNLFTWIEPFPRLSFIDATLPVTFWAILDTPIQFAYMLPDDGEVQLGNILVNVGNRGGSLDVMNADVPPSTGGAIAWGGEGGFGGPLFEWRAYNGELTGGTLELAVVPEPMTLSLCAVGLLGLAVRRIYRAL